MEERVVIDTMKTADFLQRAFDFIGGIPPDRLTSIYHYINVM
jgi:hypothetical protein